MTIEDLIQEVCNANLLVRRDRPPERINGIELADATRSARRMTSGTVLRVGPRCNADLYEGARVLFGEFAGAAVSLEGIENNSEIIFLANDEVYAILHQDAPPRPEEALELPMEWFDCAKARPNHLLIERAEMPLRRGMIELPPGARTHTRATEAVVRDVGSLVAGYAPGDRVQMAGQGGKRIAFGTNGQRELWAVPPSNVLAKYREAPPEAAIIGERGFSAPQELLEAAFSESDSAFQYDEGDRRGLR